SCRALRRRGSFHGPRDAGDTMLVRPARHHRACRKPASPDPRRVFARAREFQADHLHRRAARALELLLACLFPRLCGMIGRDQALAVRRDYRYAGLTEQQVEMLAYAEQITRDASQITEANIERLRAVGFTDLNIADIALAASF